jgi:hypothetical protein
MNIQHKNNGLPSNMDLTPKPTVYGGKMMRSKLETKWAMLFDFFGWEWRYEPFTLDGWIPDFEIKTNTGQNLLVEVKPFDPFLFTTTEEDMMPLIIDAGYGKVMKHAKSHKILLCGKEPFIYNRLYLSIGLFMGSAWLFHELYGSDRLLLDIASIKYDGAFGLSQNYGGWDDIVNKEVERKAFVMTDCQDEVIFKVFDSFYNR